MANPHLEFTIEGTGTRATLELGDSVAEASIGRSSDCNLVIASGSVSRLHARVIRQGRDFAIEDLGSSNGTFVNGARIEAARVLNDQDEVKLGSIVGRFVKPPEASVDATVAWGSEAAATLMAPPKPPADVPSPKEAPPPTRSITAPMLGQATGTATTQMPQSDPANETAAQTSPPMTSPPITPPTSTGSIPRGGVDSDTGPGFVELAAIAAGSFLVVFAIGAAILRFLP